MTTEEGSGPRGSGTLVDVGWTLLIGLTAMALRLGIARQYGAHPIGQIPWVDEQAYWSRAQEIFQGRWLPDRPFYQDPLLAYLLAGMMRVLGTTRVPDLRVGMACLGSLTPVAVFWAGRLGLGRAEGVVAGLAVAIYGPLAFTDALLEKEGPAALVAALALALSARAVATDRRWGAAALAGAAWGALALLRANALLLGPMVAALLVLGIGGLPRAGRRSRTIGLLAGFGAAVAPATLVNLAVSRPTELIVTTWQAGPNFYIGNGPFATGTYQAPPFVEANPASEGPDFAAEAGRRAGRPLGPGAVSRYWWSEGLTRWREAPGPSLRLLLHKLGLLAHHAEIPDNQDAEVVRVVAVPALAWGVLGFGGLIPWAAMGLARSPRSPFWWLLTTTTLAGLLSTAAFFVVGRYRTPWVPGLALLAGAGIIDAIHLACAGRWGGLAGRIALLAMPAAALAWRPMPDPAPDRWGHAEIGLALAYASAGELDPAIDALDDACALGPGPAARVAALRAGSPLRDQLVAEINTAWTGERNALRRARWLRQFPEHRAESFRLLELELYLHPDDPATHHELGAWWLGRGDDPAARRRAAASLAKTGRDPSAAPLLALLTSDPQSLNIPAAAASPLATRLRIATAVLRGRTDPR